MRLFLAVWPDAETVSLLVSLSRPARPGVRWADSEHWHITLRFLGDAPDAGKCLSAMDGLVLPHAPLVLLGPRTILLSPTVLAVPAAGLDELAHMIRALPLGAREGGRRPGDSRPFRGHLTLARGRNPGDLAGTALSASLAGGAVDAGFVPSAVTLVSSIRAQGRGSNRYEVVGAWPFRRP